MDATEPWGGLKTAVAMCLNISVGLCTLADTTVYILAMTSADQYRIPDAEFRAKANEESNAQASGKFGACCSDA
jgi:hypothetical protein